MSTPSAANAEAIGKADKIEWVEANAFDYLKEAESNEERYDLIILDPPSFTRNRKSVRDALRGYKEIHHRAMRLLTPGGIISTYCCSHHVSRAEFYQVIADSAVDARRTLRLIDSHSQRRDHPGTAAGCLPGWRAPAGERHCHQ